MVDKHPVKFGVDTNYVLVDLGLNFVGNIVVDWIFHVLGQNTSEPLLVEHVVIKDLNCHIQEPFGLVGIEAYFEHFVLAAALNSKAILVIDLLGFNDVLVF